jgi:hypothetical protein
MKMKTSAHGNDTLSLTWWDLVRLAIGKTLQVSALVVRRKS